MLSHYRLITIKRQHGHINNIGGPPLRLHFHDLLSTRWIIIACIWCYFSIEQSTHAIKPNTIDKESRKGHIGISRPLGGDRGVGRIARGRSLRGTEMRHTCRTTCLNLKEQAIMVKNTSGVVDCECSIVSLYKFDIHDGNLISKKQ